MRQLRLRYAGVCRACGVELDRGAFAWYDATAKQVVCLDCAADAPAHHGEEAPSTHPTLFDSAAVTDAGKAGASARREYERRVAKREDRIRARHPKLGGLLLALSEEPQSTTAWERGAKGEELLGRSLDGLADHGVKVLHDRRIPGTRANIDHIAVSPVGVCVLDAKRYKGRPHLKIEGGLLRPRTETLMVGTRRCDAIVEGMNKQVRLVGEALESVIADVPIAGMLVFIEADWPLFGGDFTTRGVKVLWPKKAHDLILNPGPLDAEHIDAVHRRLAATFPPA
ncbi:NERD domain-containing protein [Jatrophihabitans cynanchi]|uniref:NERD domain-containing protein n=1 Tax=Jatrophihabitans cynanchi TaxID=2944128 RepID=A0ABY7JUI3_9ACTN|nr:nuclease-related domain-containing protein [Jatrophihabitans sp. SB3-54]WAX56200.1 NERD domain-containing protein [Jatrophihabitans sp. SB3-54]